MNGSFNHDVAVHGAGARHASRLERKRERERERERNDDCVPQRVKALFAGNTLESTVIPVV